MQWPPVIRQSSMPQPSTATFPGEDCRLPGPQCGGTRAAVHGIQRHPAFSAGRTRTELMARFSRISHEICGFARARTYSSPYCTNVRDHHTICFFQSRSQQMFTQLLERKPREPWNGGIGGTSGAQGQRVKDKASSTDPFQVGRVWD
jgi:hypothetical protein